MLDLSKYDGAVPGPWKYDKRDWLGKPSASYYVRGNEYEYDPADDGDEGEPCMVSTAVCIVPSNATALPVCENTARLIADAPTLLRLVRELRAGIQDVADRLRQMAELELSGCIPQGRDCDGAADQLLELLAGVTG